ncbi:alpha/beta hydrolase [Pseudodonghicola flavimaris]|uniref:Alpha/beta hydrolase n=1 Tax=Pseudodonghicola flavimaris TaxID=3050036 RepID=A0ABT7F0P5_9RHOB|nr:alpha/beta hydrolase [Pseudodonghicola flavimaris]MDK3018167.1 alpha/beta hydrolase [Pseudodonghicola flavimaris]
MTRDYNALLDDEIWAFIGKTAESYPEDAVDSSITEQRRVYDAMCRAFHQPHPEGVLAEDVSADGVPVRIYTAGDPDRTVMYFHGGGFVVGGLDSHDDVCAEICARTGYRVVSVDYRLSPEHSHPAAFDDCWTATGWASRRFSDPLVLAGDSAGGNLAAAVAHHARGRLKGILGLVLIYPGLGGDGSAPSYRDNANAPLLSTAEMKFYENIRLAEGQARPEGDPTYAPLQDSDFAGLPATVIISADCDPLRDDAETYAGHLRAAGVKVHWINEQGLVHGYLRARHMSARAHDSFERIEVAIEALGQKLWPYDD